jgi:membrane fusion protein, multidrug efflux system
MSWKRAIFSVINLVIFVGAGILLFHLAKNTTAAPSEEEEEAMNPGVPTAVAVHAGEIGRMTLHRVITVYGRVEGEPATGNAPAAEAHITPAVYGLVSQVDCIEGEHVTQGQTLLTMDTRTADAQVERARAFLAAVQKAGTGSQQGGPAYLIQLLGDLAQAELDYAQGQRKLLEIASPISGVVTNVSIHAGEVAGPGSGGIEIVDTDRLVAALDIPGFEAGSVKIGQAVAMEGLGAGGKIVRVDPGVDLTTGTVSADVALPAGSGFRPGEFVSGRIQIETHADCLAVPAESIVRDPQGRARITMVNGDEHEATFRYVDVGIREGDWVEVSGEGLDAGQEIVTGGAYGLLDRSGIVVVGR